MKIISLISSVLISANSFAQNWHLNNVDETEKYSYEYWFQFENNDDTSTYQLRKISGNEPSTIKLSDNFGQAIISANITIKKTEIDSVIHLITDFEGFTEIQLKEGQYSIEITTVSHDYFALELEMDPEQFMALNVKLGLAPELTVYQINSKNKLHDHEIVEIMNCVKTNRHKFHNCLDIDNYLVMMHI